MTITEFAAANNFDANSIRSLMDFIIDRVGDKITEANAEDVLAAYIPQWLAAQDRMAVIAVTHLRELGDALDALPN